MHIPFLSELFTAPNKSGKIEPPNLLINEYDVGVKCEDENVCCTSFKSSLIFLRELASTVNVPATTEAILAQSKSRITIQNAGAMPVNANI